MASRQHESPLRRKLRELSQYAGVRRDNLYEFLGQELRALWHISETDHPETVLVKVSWQLERLISQLRREGHRPTARYSFNITSDEDVERLDLGQRQEELAKRRGPSAKSSRNYMSKVILPQFEVSLRNDPPPPVPDDFLAKALANPGGGRPLTFASIESTSHAETPGRPNKVRRLVIIGAVAVLIVAAGTGLAVWRISEPPQAAPDPGTTTSVPQLPEGTAQPATVPGETRTQVCAVRDGCPVFDDPGNPTRRHEKITFMHEVEVSCKIYARSMESVEWWYRLASAPYDNEWSAPAINFLNGDPPEGPYPTDVDEAVPDC